VLACGVVAVQVKMLGLGAKQRQRYQLLYVYRHPYEGAGTLWNEGGLHSEGLHLSYSGGGSCCWLVLVLQVWVMSCLL
jgi:hypothetical protein